MKVIIAGGRDFVPSDSNYIELTALLLEIKASEVVCGMATGADTFGASIGKKLGLPIKEFPAEWFKYGRSAGPKRNKEMAQYADVLIAYPGGRGTANMKKEAEKAGLKILSLT